MLLQEQEDGEQHTSTASEDSEDETASEEDELPDGFGMLIRGDASTLNQAPSEQLKWAYNIERGSRAEPGLVSRFMEADAGFNVIKQCDARLLRQVLRSKQVVADEVLDRALYVLAEHAIKLEIWVEHMSGICSDDEVDDEVDEEGDEGDAGADARLLKVAMHHASRHAVTDVRQKHRMVSALKGYIVELTRMYRQLVKG